jgi:hypothetical protein
MGFRRSSVRIAPPRPSPERENGLRGTTGGHLILAVPTAIPTFIPRGWRPFAPPDAGGGAPPSRRAISPPLTAAARACRTWAQLGGGISGTGVRAPTSTRDRRRTTRCSAKTEPRSARPSPNPRGRDLLGPGVVGALLPLPVRRHGPIRRRAITTPAGREAGLVYENNRSISTTGADPHRHGDRALAGVECVDRLHRDGGRRRRKENWELSGRPASPSRSHPWGIRAPGAAWGRCRRTPWPRTSGRCVRSRSCSLTRRTSRSTGSAGPGGERPSRTHEVAHHPDIRVIPPTAWPAGGRGSGGPRPAADPGYLFPLLRGGWAHPLTKGRPVGTGRADADRPASLSLS